MDSTQPVQTPTTMHRHDFFRLVGTSIGAILLTHSVMGCAHQGGDPAPDTSPRIDFTLKLADAVNANLAVKGGYVVSENIIIAHTMADTYVAVSANCPLHNSQLVFKGADNVFYCPLDASRFDTTGKVLVGPATTPLTQYTVEANQTTGLLRVHN